MARGIILPCALCGKQYRCRCPWHMPFDKWPKHYIAQLRGEAADGGAPR